MTESKASAAPGVRPGRKRMTFTDRALASIAGSVSTSFLMTPLDVIKTRLQTQAQDVRPVSSDVGLAKGPPCPVHGTIPHASVQVPTTLRWLRPSPPLPVPLAMQTPAMCIYPDKCSVAKLCETEVVMREGRLTGVWDGMAKMVRVEGWRSLWRGLLPTLAMTIPSQVTYMSFYDVFRKSILSIEAPVPNWRESLTRSSPVPDFPCDMPCEHDDAFQDTVPMTQARVPLLVASLVSGAGARSILSLIHI